MSKVGDMVIDKVPPPCDGCDHPADKVDSSPHYQFQSNDIIFRCRGCWNFWVLRDGAFSNPLHVPPSVPMSDPRRHTPQFTWPDVDNRPPPRGGFF